MTILSIVVSIIGLSLFEIVNSVDNAVINAEILTTVNPRGQRWFLSWGFILAVVVVRGVLPWIIVWLAVPSLGPIGALTAAFSPNPMLRQAIHMAAPSLLAGGSMFLILIFLHWLFLEEKHIGLPHERFFLRQGGWFYAIASVLLFTVLWKTTSTVPAVALAAALGSSAFFIVHGFREYAERNQLEKLLKSPPPTSASDMKKLRATNTFSTLAYLEAIDAAFSIDSVVGAFAFSLSVPIIIIGTGIGAFVVRQLTVRSIYRIKQYVYLKNGALYSVAALGIIMLAEAFGVDIPSWISPLATAIIILFFLEKSRREKSH